MFWGGIKVIKSRNILIIVILLTIILISVVITSYSNKAVVYKEIKIQKGQTLWNIAAKYSTNKDPRKLIYQMKKINGIEDSIIQPGEVIKVPVID